MRNYLRCVAAVIFLAVSAYLVSGFVQSEERPDTETARLMRITDSIDAEGQVLCDAEYVTAPFGTVYYTVSEGRWVSGGTVVAVEKSKADDYYARRSISSCVKAPCAGYFSKRLGEGAPENAVGRVISGGWRFVTALGDTESLRVGQRLELTVFDKYPAVIEAIDGKKVTVRCKTGLCAVLGMNRLKARLCLADLEGLRVPEKAIHSDDSGDFVYVLQAGMVKRAPVEVIYKKSDLCLVKSSELCDGMEVIVK